MRGKQRDRALKQKPFLVAARFAGIQAGVAWTPVPKPLFLRTCEAAVRVTAGSAALRHVHMCSWRHMSLSVHVEAPPRAKQGLDECFWQSHAVTLVFSARLCCFKSQD